MIMKYKKKIKKIVENLFEGSEPKYFPQLSVKTLKNFLQYAPIIKKSDFKSEKEMRLIFKITSPLANFSNTTDFYEAYVDFKSFLKGIRLAPDAREEDFVMVFCCLKNIGLPEFANKDFVTKAE